MPAQPSALAPASHPVMARAASGDMPLAELLSQAQALQAAGDTAGAEALYAAWIAHSASPLQHVALFNRGTLLTALERRDEAIAVYLRAIELSPSFAQARLNQGNLLERKGEPDVALAQ